VARNETRTSPRSNISYVFKGKTIQPIKHQKEESTKEERTSQELKKKGHRHRILSVDRFVNALEPDLATMANYDTGMVSAVLTAQLNPGRSRYAPDIF
jgi:hypothetical protein